LILLITFFSFVSGVLYSLRGGSLLRPGAFVAAGNYLRVLSSGDFFHSMYFSLVFAIFNVAGSYLLGLGLALLVNQNMPGRVSSELRCSCPGSFLRSFQLSAGAG
jgi:ABC-type sugar transport system permease subunit